MVSAVTLQNDQEALSQLTGASYGEAKIPLRDQTAGTLWAVVVAQRQGIDGAGRACGGSIDRAHVGDWQGGIKGPAPGAGEPPNAAIMAQNGAE